MTEISSLYIYIGIGLAGAFGAVLRHGVDRFLHYAIPTSFPAGIMLVNLSGSLFIGFLTGWMITGVVDGSVFLVLSVGFAGSYTTFSGWMVQTVELMENGLWKSAVWNLVLHVIPGWLLTLGGLFLGMHGWQ